MKTIGPSTKRSALLYVRARTANDAAASQLQKLRHLAAGRGWEVVGEYLDLPGGGTTQREGLVLEVHRGVHGNGVLLCPALSQLTTSVREAVHLLLDLAMRGWDLVTADGTDTSASANKNELTTMFASLAALDRAGVAERARAALDRAKREGRPLGRKRREVPVDRIRELLASGLSWRQIAHETGIPSSTLRTALKREPSMPVQVVGLLEAA